MNFTSWKKERKKSECERAAPESWQLGSELVKGRSFWARKTSLGRRAPPNVFVFFVSGEEANVIDRTRVAAGLVRREISSSLGDGPFVKRLLLKKSFSRSSQRVVSFYCFF